MARKPLGLDAQGVQKTMRLHNYLGDGMGQFGLNIISGMVGILIYFYTDKVGIAAGAAGTIMFLAKLVDAVTDLVMGWVVDRTKSRWGRARPWLLWMAGPAFIAVVLLFTVPAASGDGTKFAYALITNAFATAIVYTAIAIPFTSMQFYATRSSEERSKMGVVRAVFAYSIGMVIAIFFIPITNALGGDQNAWIIFGVGMGALATLGLVLAFLANPERNVDTGETTDQVVPFLEAVGLLFRNKYWVIMLVVMAVMNISYGITANSGIYYVKWILGDENLMALLGLVGLIPTVVGFLIVTPLVKRFGPTKTVLYTLLVGIAATVVRIFFPYDLWALLIFGSLVQLASIPLMALGGVLVTNTISYGEWQHGKRLVGMANAANGFGTKIGSGLGAAAIGWILALGAYDGTATVQPDSAIGSILAISIWVPGILLLAMYVLLRFFDLDAKYPQILKDLDERANAVEAQPAADA